MAGLITQGDNWRTASITTFYSAKLNSAQHNYLVHEIEMLAGIETMLRYKDILQGIYFKWITDYKGLMYLVNQKNLLGQQACWMEKISSFVFEVVYIAKSDKVVADALSRLYLDDSEGMFQSRTKFMYYDVMDNDKPSYVEGSSLSMVTWKPQKLPGAEMGCPESLKEFAVHMCDCFVLRGPGE